MCRRVALRSSLRITLVLFIGVALLPAPCVSMLVSAMGQGQGRGPRTAPPRPGKSEGAFPDLDDVKNESSMEREPQRRFPLRYLHKETLVSHGTGGELAILR